MRAKVGAIAIMAISVLLSIPGMGVLLGLLYWTEGTVWMWVSSAVWVVIFMPAYVVFFLGPVMEKIYRAIEG